MKKIISFSTACFNEEQNIIPTYREFIRTSDKNKKYNYEFVFVDNGSADKTRELITKLAKKDKRVVGVFLSRNFGPESSGQASIDYASGDAVVSIEADLQDPPDLIPEFIKKWEEGYDVVVGIRTKIEDPFPIAFARKAFYRVFKFMANIDIPVGGGAFGLIDRKGIDAMKSLPEKYRFFRGIRAWVGFKTAYIKYSRRKRERGKSSYNFFDYLKHSERGIFGFSYLLLDLLVYGGLLLVIISFIFIIVYLFTVLVFGNPIKAPIPLMLTIVFFGGIQILAISIIGKYIQIISEETKERPVYIIDELINVEKNAKK